jgi:hypothetical protein
MGLPSQSLRSLGSYRYPNFSAAGHHLLCTEMQTFAHVFLESFAIFRCILSLRPARFVLNRYSLLVLLLSQK